ncbi:uncharacterized protein LTR77_010985 [Saxophila tyrrhenica]|uniref:DUF7730 domain-containing protein n=1 Tax=Saxophila tyrrhenica TaxID=1690608 RepID=A0AAV9NX94_9PEZI|nr:hypothetical protein LTR77_010985 [Saxophila tyrrhenica]
MARGSVFMSAMDKDRIETVIAPWRSSNQQPAFTFDQLVAIATRMMDDNEASEARIADWISATFPFYAKSTEQIHKERFDSRDTPDANSSAFDFFALSPELRNAIYEMVFSYGKAGLFVGSDKFVTTSTLWDGCPRIIWPPSLDIPGKFLVLEALLVSKHFYVEAMPVFYRVNLFHCGEIWSLCDTLKHLAPCRAQHLTHLSFHYKGTESGAAEAFALLGQLEHLRKLDIHVFEDYWLVRGRRSGQEEDKVHVGSSVVYLEGLANLRAIRGLHVVSVGNSPTLEQELKPDMLRPKARNSPTLGREPTPDVPRPKAWTFDDHDSIKSLKQRVIETKTREAERVEKLRTTMLSWNVEASRLKAKAEYSDDDEEEEDGDWLPLSSEYLAYARAPDS